MKEDSQKKMQLMQKLKRLEVQNLDLNLNLYGEKSTVLEHMMDNVFQLTA